MDPLILARNLIFFRRAKALSQETLSQKIGVSLSRIEDLEAGRGYVDMAALHAMRRAFEVRSYDLFFSVKSREAVRFRLSSSQPLSRGQRSFLLGKLSIYLEDYRDLEKKAADFRPLAIADLIGSRAWVGPTAAALACRAAMEIDPTKAIDDIQSLLEEKGIKVFCKRVAYANFHSLSMSEKEPGGPLIAVNLKDSWNRCRFLLAAELGSLIMRPESYRVSLVDEEPVAQMEAEKFAEYFLMPDQALRLMWAEKSHLPFFEKLIKVHVFFGLSLEKILSRVFKLKLDCDLIKIEEKIDQNDKDNFIYKNFPINSSFIENYLKKENKVTNDFCPNQRLNNLIGLAVARGQITVSRGAEILRIAKGAVAFLAHLASKCLEIPTPRP